MYIYIYIYIHTYTTYIYIYIYTNTYTIYYLSASSLVSRRPAGLVERVVGVHCDAPVHSGNVFLISFICYV